MKFTTIKALACLGSLAVLCLQSNQAEAIFASVKSTGMAATAISYPLDSLCGAYNPAGEPFIGDRFDVEAAWVRDWGQAQLVGNHAINPLTGEDLPTNGTFDGMKTKDAYPVGFGINKNWCLGCDWELATSIIVYNRNYQKTSYTQPQFLLGTSNPGLEYINETISPIIAIKWCDSHSFAISINYQIERVKVNGIQNFDHLPDFSSPSPLLQVGTLYPGFVTNRGYDYATGWGFTLGYLGRLTDCLSVGVTYQPKTSMTRLTKYKGFLAQKGKLDIPEKIGAGISYRFLNCVVVAFDVEFIRWKPIKALSNPLIASDSPIPGIPAPLGANNGPGFGFINQWYYRAGVEWTIDENWVARIGYRFANTPIRRSQTAVNILTLDTVESFLTAGGTYNLNACTEVSALFAWGFENKIKGKDSIPAFIGGGETNIKETKYALGVALGWKF